MPASPPTDLAIHAAEQMAEIIQKAIDAAVAEKDAEIAELEAKLENLVGRCWCGVVGCELVKHGNYPPGY